MDQMGNASLGVCTFFASAHPNESCGMNGLPLTPNSIQILGEFQMLKSLNHPFLCKYVDITRGKHERLMVVSEHYPCSVWSLLTAGAAVDLVRLAGGLLHALHHLHQRRLVARTLTGHTVRLDAAGDVKLAQYGLYHMTGRGEYVSFPIGDVRYLAPEVLAAGLRHELVSGPASDVWSAGMLLAEAALQRTPLGPHEETVADTVSRVLAMLARADVLTGLAEDADVQDRLRAIPEDLRDLISQCLTVSPSDRPSVSTLLSHPALSTFSAPPAATVLQPFPLTLDGDSDSLLSPPAPTGPVLEVETHLRSRPLHEVYHLWKLAGGDLETELRNQGRIKAKPAILSVPNVVTLEGETFGVRRDRDTLYDPSIVTLPLEPLLRRLRDVAPAALYPLLEKRCGPMLHSQSQMELQDTARLPLVIREADIEYQLHRITLFSRLIEAYPYLAGRLRVEARTDIPPLYRAHSWAGLLGVAGRVRSNYDQIDKQTAIPTDRQIEVDIPRCHQYDELLSSPAGHQKLKRVLKAWVVTHRQYVYWQGLDSLAAPLVHLNFNDEALAYASLSAFIDRYLHGFFLKDNAAVIHEYLAVFSLLTGFVDPALGNHLRRTGFVPELYAIPWFLTMFTHVFPLHKIFQLWDALLLESAAFPLCVGVALLQQLRQRLLTFGFNECILLFSDMPDINMEGVVTESRRIQSVTPASVLHREHAPPPSASTAEAAAGRLAGGSPSTVEEAAAGRLAGPPLTQQQLKALRVPRLSVQDLVSAGGGGGARPEHVCVIDVRQLDHYQQGCYPGAISAPPGSLFAAAPAPPEEAADGATVAPPQLSSSAAAQAVRAARGALMVVYGGRHADAVNQTAESLLALDYPRVCTLHGGVDALKEAHLLQVPPSR